MINRHSAPSFREVEHIAILQAEPARLDNGLPVFQIKAGEQDIVRIEFIFENTAWNPSKPLSAYVANALLQEGTSIYTAAELAEKIDYYGAFLQKDFTFDNSSLVLYSLNKHLPLVLPLVKAMLCDATYPQHELDTFIRNQKQRLSVNLEKNDFLSRRLFNQVLFKDTLYGHAANPEDYDQLKREDVYDYYKKAYQPSNCTIVLAGNSTPEIFNLLNREFGRDWETDVNVHKNEFSFLQGAGDVHLIERPDALQSALRIGQISINRTHPDFPALQVLNTVLGGYFGSRLMANIREDKGYTYGIGSALVSLQNSGYFFIASEVGAEVCGAAVAEVEKEINRLKTELVPEEELQLVRNYMMGSMLGSLENAFSHADKFKNIYFFGLGYDYYDRYVQTLKTVTSAQLLELANCYLNFDAFEKVIVGKQ
jgi:zinc protease